MKTMDGSLSGKKFTRVIEDFSCAHCGTEVTGNGYTNHCPKCLWSKHVDIHPGDRAATCKGPMKPVAGGEASDERFLIHRCEACGYEKRNALAADDDFEAFVKTVEERVETKMKNHDDRMETHRRV